MKLKRIATLVFAITVAAATAGCSAPLSSAPVSSAANGSESSSASSSQQEVEPQAPAPLTQGKVVEILPTAEKYPEFFAVAEEAFIVPGLEDKNLVPQGMCAIPGNDKMVFSLYSKNKDNSVLAIVDLNTGRLEKSVRLLNEDGSAYSGHAGGLAANESSLWCVTGGIAQRLSVAELLAAEDMSELRFLDSFETYTRASLSCMSGKEMWVGDFFTTGGNYETEKTHHTIARDGSAQHAWIVGFEMDGDTPTPAYILSVPDKIQGVTRLADGRFVLSQSYGRNNEAALLIYGNVLEGEPHSEGTVGDKTLPLWYLDSLTQVSKITLPPMSEAVEVWNGELYLLFESGAETYRVNGTDPTDMVYKLKID